MKCKKISLMLMVSYLSSFGVQSAELICGGTVEELAYHANTNGNGEFYIRLSGMNKAVAFCSPDIAFSVSDTPYKTNPETCKMLYSTFLAAQASGRVISNIYFDGALPSSCQSFPSWSRANIRYYALLK